MSADKQSPTTPRRLFRFTLRSLLIAITVFGVWLGWRVNRAHRQQNAVQSIRAYGGIISYDYQIAAKRVDARPSGPAWLIELIGVDFFHKVEGVDLTGDPYSANRPGEFDAQVVTCLNDLPDVTRVRLQGRQACDETFAQLSNWTKLDSIDVEPYRVNSTEQTYPPLTDAGIDHLTRLKNLKFLWLGQVALGDESLASLGKIQNLESLYVYGHACTFTDAGLASLGGLKHVTQLHVGTSNSEGSEFTDDGLASLHGLESLEFLGVRGRTISDRGLQYLAQLPKLKELELASDSISDESFAEFSKRTGVRVHQTLYTSFAKSIREQLMAAHTIDDDRLPTELSVSNLKFERREFLVTNLAETYFKHEHRKRDEFKRRALADEELDADRLESLLGALAGR